MKLTHLNVTKVIVAVISIYCMNTAAAQDFNYLIKHITIEEGLSHTDASTITQDKTGFVWVGTLYGLDKFDGYEIKSFYNRNNPKANAYINRISKIIVDTPGSKLWIGTEAGLDCFNLKTETYEKIRVADRETQLSIEKPISKLLLTRNNHLFYSGSSGKLFASEIDTEGKLKTYPLQEIEKDKLVCLAMAEDKKGNVWVATDSGFYVYNASGQLMARLNDIMTTLKMMDIKSMQPGNNNNLLIGLVNGFLVLELNSFYAHNGINNRSLKQKWVPMNPLSLKHFLSGKGSTNVKCIKEQSDGSYWIGTNNGLFLVAATSEGIYEYKAFQSSEWNNKSNISSNQITDLYTDKAGCLWISTSWGGVNMIDLNQKRFMSLRKDPLKSNSLSGNYVRSLLEDEKGNLWIGTQSDGLNYYNFETGIYKNFVHDPSNPSGLSDNSVLSLAKDILGRLWIGTNNGLNILMPDGRFEKINLTTEESDPRVNKQVNSLNIDIYGQVWAGTWNSGIYRIRYNGTGDYQIESINVTGRQAYSISSNRVTFVYTDGKTPEVLIATDKGLNQVLLDTTGFIREVHHFTGNERKGADLSSSYVWPILRENDHTIWAGTLGSGGINKIIFKEDGTYTIKQYTQYNGMPIYDIEGMLMDNHGKLWLGGKNLMTFDPVNEKFDAFSANDGFQLSSFKNGSAHKGKKRLYFGGINGVIYFNPDSIQESGSNLPLVLTDLIVDNKHVLVNKAVTKKAILENAITFTKSISLNHLENNFAIKFAALYFPNPDRCRYRYKLVGYNKDWVYVNASLRTAYFSNLNYGKYCFVVEASSGSDEWICSGVGLEINILPPWWKTATAYFSYFSLLVLAILGIHYYKERMYKLKQELELHVMEEKKNEELHQSRLQFFTNISHEFRTPLTLILGPTEKLLNEGLHPVQQRNFLQLINKNTKRLLSLINELMDFRQVESQSIKLNAFDGDLNEFVKTLSYEFEEVAISKNIWYTVKANTPIENIWFDQCVLEKILINLISNAFKYTVTGGNIQVELLSDLSQCTPVFTAEYSIKPNKIAAKYAWIKIADSGIGISAASISNIFDRYYRIQESDQDRHLGSGVGLAIVRTLALQHHCEIRVYSERNKGTQFLIGLPCGKEIYANNELASQDEYQREPNSIAAYINDFNFAMEERDGHHEKTDSHPQKHRILIAEDNNDMRAFIYDSLVEDYNIVLAVNGEEALAKTKEFLPELIISDLVMPVRNGIEFCTDVKQDISTNHIPFILITAMSSPETQLESAAYGADIYFPKPFSMKLLQLTIRNIIETRVRIKERYSKDIYAETRELVHNNNEKKFIDVLITIIEENIDNTDLEIDWITRQVGINRTNLYTKVKSITGQTLGEFILMLRLKRAAKILATEEVTASETMYKVGIQSQSYFIKSFKKEFGKTPFAFQQEHKKGLLVPKSD